MTSVLAILGFAVLFAVFGLLAPGEENAGCGGGSCALEDGGDACGECPHGGKGWDWKPGTTPEDHGTEEVRR